MTPLIKATAYLTVVLSALASALAVGVLLFYVGVGRRVPCRPDAPDDPR